MKLEKKTDLAARTLGVGKGRITFNQNRLAEIKEAITKQDIRDLVQSGAIIIKEQKGRAAVVHRNTRRRRGSIKKTVKNSKRKYIVITRKLRAYLATQKEKESITNDEYRQLRKEIRARSFKSLSHMKERIKEKQ